MVKRIELSNPCPHKIIQIGINPKDIAVLQEALRGENYTAIAKQLGINERTVRSKLDNLEARGIIEKNRQKIPLVDTIALWEYVFVTFLKLHLPSAIPSTTSQASEIMKVSPTPAPPGWSEALNELRRDNPLYDKLVRCAFVLIGTEYDAILLISTQSRDEYARFCSNLQRKGIVEKIWGSMVVEWAGYTWNPLAVPDAKEVEDSMRHVSDAIKSSLR